MNALLAECKPTFVMNALTLTKVPVKVHKKRRNMTEAYHKRIQKKWTKRFGLETKSTPVQLCLSKRVLDQINALAKNCK